MAYGTNQTAPPPGGELPANPPKTRKRKTKKASAPKRRGKR